jgi:uridine kinase
MQSNNNRETNASEKYETENNNDKEQSNQTENINSNNNNNNKSGGRLTFDQGFYTSVRAIQLLRQKKQRTIFVAIAGPSGSGKTTLAKKISNVMPGTLIISLDNYLDATRKVIDFNFDDDRLVDFDLLIKNIKDLQNERATNMPLYDFRKSGRYAYVRIEPPESKVVIIEGIYALHERIASLMDLKIAVSGGVHYDLVKRVFRDIQRTGQDASDVVKQITDTVYPMYKAFIEPTLEQADIRISNQFNPFSGFLSPDYILKSESHFTQQEIEQFVERLRSNKRLENVSLNNNNNNTDWKIEPQTESYIDIFLLPPEVDSEVSGESENGGISNADEEDSVPIRDSTQFIRVRSNNGKYWVLFSESLREGRFIITPHMEFLIDVATLGGLMALGYKVDAILNRNSTIYDVYGDGTLILMIDNIEQLNQTYIQIKGHDRELVDQVANMMNIKTFVPDSYIELFHKQNKTVTNSNVPTATGTIGINTPRNDIFLQSKL